MTRGSARDAGPDAGPDQLYFCGGQCCPSPAQCVLKLSSDGAFSGLACCPGAIPVPYDDTVRRRHELNSDAT